MNPQTNPIVIFLADDDEDDRELFANALQQLGYTASLFTAENGDALLNKLQATDQLPDLIFIDLNMPVKDGFIILKEIRQEEKWNHTPIVILSTSDHMHYIEKAHQLKANLYIPKPSSFTHLKNIIAYCLTHRTTLLQNRSLESFVPAVIPG